MKILGITGSIGSGKSFALKCFKRLPKVVSYSSDKSVHKLFIEDRELISQVSTLFPEAVNNGMINRKILGDIVFADRSKKEILEGFIYPKLLKQRQNIVKQALRDKAELVVLEIPLLFENGLDEECDYTMAVYCNSLVQKQRVLRRGGMSQEKFNNILQHQMTTGEKLKLSDFSVNTGQTKAQTYRKIKEIHSLLS